MPLYEYRCSGCGHRFEALVQGRSGVACPACRGRKLDRLLSVFAVGGPRSNGDAGGDDIGACGTCGDPRGPGSCDSDD
jgi:putative FmdB family regulatory protein